MSKKAKQAKKLVPIQNTRRSNKTIREFVVKTPSSQ
ncbi:hypothetical protein KAOT1_17578 [Kordia algicida OT-1]|uniref:Uncharacterized protein n=1 Tax=Kordia algicida OT-1 TaxID=391587 RepID=A9DSY1_9FLAO|nr:hypothetical protein KAOT1_17578 [Kordia algicida OT-1]